MPINDLPPQALEWVNCAISAAAKYRVPANVVLAITEKEGGKLGQSKSNRNGAHDIGPMQFNTAYLNDLARYEITANDVAVAGCYSYDLAAWRLRQHIHTDTGDLWTRAANYHSRSQQYNQAYRTDLIRRAVAWATWLDAWFLTNNLLKSGTTLPMGENGHKAEQIVRQQRSSRADVSTKTGRSYRPITGYVPRMLIPRKQ